MRLYWEFMKNTFQSQLAYRTNTWLALLGQIITVVINISIWQVLLHEGGATAGTKFITARDMVTYTIISNAVALFMTNEVIWTLDWKIQTGEIAIDLTKPLDLRVHLLARTIGSIGSSAVIQMIPFLTFCAIFFGIQTPTLENAILFGLAAFTGLIINFMICYLLGLVGFWWQRVRQFNTLLRVFIRLFAGSFVPLWFFPKGLVDVANFLPFRFIYYTPVAIFMGKVDGMDALYQIMLELLWIGAFLVIERFMWNRAIRRLVVQGG